MFELNPLATPDALWQHTVMVVISAVLGYIIGYIAGKTVIAKLEGELDYIEKELVYLQKPADGQACNPATWPSQAEMAEKGNREKLKAWQDILKGGREQ
jgi:hypothetical protein